MTEKRLAVLLVVPAVVAALGLGGIEAWRVVRPQSPLFTAPITSYSLAEAIAAGDVRQTYAFLRAGQDPNELITVRHPELTNGEWVFVSPIMWATATRQMGVVQMLVGFGARLDRPADRRAPCVAEVRGQPDIAEFLRTHASGAAREECGPPDGRPLVRLLAPPD